MPLPARIIALAIQFAVKAGIAVLRGGAITSKFSSTRIGDFLVEAERRWALGRDGAISTIVRIS